VDAIVNAANRHLQHGAGVAGAILHGGGPVIQHESDAWVRQHGPVSHAAPAYTHAGNLPCRFVIHAVGPVWGEGDEEARLAAAVTGSLRCAAELGLQSIAIPAISTGIFGFPKASAAHIMLAAIQRYFVDESQTSLTQVRLVLFDQPTVDAFILEWKVLDWDE
jgi:O-acetyl-ADP-ribose deacetylase (regulator of RNase III)